MHEQIEITTTYITLGQFIKLANVLESGGMVKGYLKETGAKVNEERDHRRGRKLYPDDVVELENFGTYIVTKTIEGG